MTENGYTKAELHHLQKDIREIKDSIKTMSDTISTIAVQQSRLDNVEKQMDSLWISHRSLIDPDGVVPNMQKQTGALQQSQETLADEFRVCRTWQWTVIAFNTVIMVTIAIKAFA